MSVAVLGALSFGCETGPYSLGFDDCPERECGAMPAMSMCLSGDLPLHTCQKDLMNGGLCSWQATCPELEECEPAQCGTAPELTMCPSDIMPVLVCVPNGGGGCSWQENCAKRGCAEEDCGARPPGSFECVGVMGDWACAPDAERICRWSLPEGCNAQDP